MTRPKKGDRGLKGLQQLMKRYGPEAEARIREQRQMQQQPSGSSRLEPLPDDVAPEPDLAFGLASDFAYECETCHDMGVVREDVPVSHKNFGKLVPCQDCRGDVQLEKLQRLSRLNDDLLQATFGQFDSRTHLHTVVNRIQTWVRNPYGWLTLTGPHGTGKTHLMAALAQQFIEQGTPALYLPLADLLADLQATFHPNSDQVYSVLFANVMEAEVLLLDEAEKFHGTSWAQVQVFRLLEHRSRNLSKYKTVLATNTDLRPLIDTPGSVDLYHDPMFPNYIESRIGAGTIIGEFWLEGDFRPIMKAARATWEQKELM